MIPSEVYSIEMYHMDFEEFLWALGDELLMPYLENQLKRPSLSIVFIIKLWIFSANI